MSWRVVNAPRLNRNELLTMSSGKRIASNTAEGSVDPLAHAEPIEQAIPAMSSAMWTAWQSNPGKATLQVCGSRGAPSPLITTPMAASRNNCSNRSRSAAIRAARRRVPLPYLQRMVQADRQFNRFRTGSQGRLLKTAKHPRLHPRRTLYDQGPDASRPVKLVRRERQRGHPQLPKMDRDLPHGLNRIGMEGNPQLTATLDQRRERLYDARFIVGQHDAHQTRSRYQQFAKVGFVYDPPAIDTHSAYVVPKPLEMFSRTADTRMFHRRDQNTTRRRTGHSQQRQVVGFRTAAGQHDSIRLQPSGIRAQEAADSLPCILEHLSSHTTAAMRTRGITVAGQ